MSVERFWTYGDTDRHGYPLVLIFGREGNNEGPMRDVMGWYDFALSPRSLFWNTSYGVVARMMGVGSAAALKELCQSRRGSPVVFSNVSPLPLKDLATGKGDLRRGVEEQVQGNIDTVFNLMDRHRLVARTALVILSVGPNFELRETGLTAIQSQCSRRSIPLLETPYFASRATSSEYDKSIPADLRKATGELLRKFI